MSAAVMLVRHPPVARAWAGRCYGRSDMGWSRDGARLAAALADRLSGSSFGSIVHSGALRTRRLAEAIGARIGAPVVEDGRWLERDFGTWEGRRWQAIWRETGDAMDRLMTDPESFRAGGGETGAELSRRAYLAWQALPRAGYTLVIAHGGPIAAIRCRLAGKPLDRMIDFVPDCGDTIVLDR